MLQLIMLGVFVALLGGAYFRGHSDGVDAQEKRDEPKIAQANQDRDRAVISNQSLQLDLKGIRDEVTACNTAVTKLHEDSDTAIAGMKPIIQAAEERTKAMADILAKFKAAARPAKPVPANLQCEAARQVLGDLSDAVAALDALGLPKRPKANLRVQ